MILSSVLTFARAQVQTNIDGLTDENGLVYANEANADFHRRLVEKGVDASQLQEASITGVVNTGIYAYPTAPASILALKTIELNYGNTTLADYKVATQIDVANLPSDQSYSFYRVNADTNSPQFDDRGNSFEIFPTPISGNNITNLIRLFYYAQPSVYTAVSNNVSFPENIDATILGWRIGAMYLYSLGGENLVKGDLFNAKYEERVKQYISTFARGSQQPIQATPLQIDGWQF